MSIKKHVPVKKLIGGSLFLLLAAFLIAQVPTIEIAWVRSQLVFSIY